MEQKEYKAKRSSMPELAKDFNVSERTMRRMTAQIKSELGKRNGHFYSPEQVETIVKYYGRPWFLVPFVWLVNISEALARRSPNYAELPAAIDGDHDPGYNGEPLAYDSIDVSAPFLHPVTLLTATLVMIYSTEDLALSFVNNPHRRSRGNKILRRINAILMITIASAIIVAAGYFFGKMVLAR